MKQLLNEIQRMQQLAGLNEWKIQQPPLYRKGQTVKTWDEGPVTVTVVNIIKGYDNVMKKVRNSSLHFLHTEASIKEWEKEEKKGYYYKLEFVGGEENEEVWASELWMKKNTSTPQDLDDAALQLEWKIQKPAIIKPDEVEQHGYIDYDTIGTSPHFIMYDDEIVQREWLDEYFPNWIKDGRTINEDIYKKGIRAYYIAVIKAAKLKHGKDITIKIHNWED